MSPLFFSREEQKPVVLVPKDRGTHEGIVTDRPEKVQMRTFKAFSNS